MKQLALKQIVYERTQNDCFQTSLNELELIKCFQDYGVGQTAAEYINGAFNGQKGFKAGQNLIFYIYNGKILIFNTPDNKIWLSTTVLSYSLFG